MMYLKRSHFLCIHRIQIAKMYNIFKKTEKIEYSVLLHFTLVRYVVKLWNTFGRH